MSQRPKVLVVENQYLLALDICDIVVKAGGVVIGPVPSVASALTLVEKLPPDVALLDIRVEDGLVYPVADRLMQLRRPFAFMSSEMLRDIPPTYADIENLGKPAFDLAVSRWLEAQMGHLN